MNVTHATIGSVTTRQHSRHRRHNAHSTRNSRMSSVSLPSNHSRPELFSGFAAGMVAIRVARTVFRYDGYTLGDGNCLYLYGPEDIRY